ncbi:MAG: DUF1289 domain-containing protein [Candidatus Sericytochromatia bacterium]|nr:DUF1289 domain-containing protein [Candidatus Sericytochromatia bacterium]
MPKKGTIPSPCVRRCDRHQKFPWCATCRRTADEIRQWEQLDDPSRRKVLARMASRQRQETAHEGQAP